MCGAETDESTDAPPSPPDTYRKFKGKEEREKDRAWKTGFIVVQDKDGRVVVDNSLGNFKDKIARKANTDDAIYMLQVALNDFTQDKIILKLRDLINEAQRES